MTSSKNTIEYIASGTAYLRTNSPRNADSEENRKYISEMLSHVSKSSNHKFGLLFNAFTESQFGERLRKYSGYDSIHADSGGLQIITQGKQVTSAIKDEIYSTQGKWSDLGMAFDEIPIGTTAGKSGRNDVTNRWFKSDEMEHYARETGRNIKRQIEVYLDEKSKCKPILITQGNCYDSYMKWVDFILDEIPRDHHKYIGGIAMGAAALGTGTLEDIERAFYFKQINFDTDHLHVLGVGSAKRMLPYLIFRQNGLYDGVSVSYDSTTHTSGVELGIYHRKTKKQIVFDRRYSKIYEEIFNDISLITDMTGMDPKKFHECMNNGYTKYVDELGRNEFDFLRSRTGFIISSITNFVQHIDWMLESKENMLEVALENKFLQPAKFLYNVKTLDDFNYWLSHFKQHVPSNRVSSSEPMTLDAMFE